MVNYFSSSELFDDIYKREVIGRKVCRKRKDAIQFWVRGPEDEER
jgi:hypothetical protein